MAYRSPVSSYTVTDRFGPRPPLPFHYGVDYDNVMGTPITSIDDGRVASIGFQANGLGNYVVVQLKASDGTLLNRYAVYGHLRDPSALAIGANIDAGGLIGYMGNTGLSVPIGGGDGSHLHLAISTSLTLSADNYIQIGSFDSDTGPNAIQGDLRANKNDLIIGFGGNDTIDGKTGDDTVEYQVSIDQIWFARWDSVQTTAIAYDVDGSGLWITKDELYNVEFISDNGGRNVIDTRTADLLTLYVGSSSASTRYVIPTQDYQNVKVDGGAGQDVVVVWGLRSQWQLTDAPGPGYWLTAGSTPPAGARLAAPTHIIDIANIESVEFADGVYSISELLGTVPVGGKATVGIRVMPGQDPFEEQDNGSWVGYDFEVYMDRVLTEDVTVRWTVRGYGTNGTNSSDFADGTSGTEVIRAGNLMSRLSINVLGDNIPEFDETFRIEITIDSSDTDIATIGTGIAYGTIVNDDGFISNDDDFGDDFATASLVPSDPNALNGWIENPADVDMFKVFLWEGMTYNILFSSSGTTRILDPAFKLYDENGVEISITDLNPDPEDFSTEFMVLTSSVHYLSVESASNSSTGDYQILLLPNNNSYDGDVGGTPVDGEFSSSKSQYTYRFMVNPEFGTDRSFWLRTDAAVTDLSAFDITVFELNGTIVNGEWENRGGGRWEFAVSASIRTHYFVRILATDEQGYGPFTVARLEPGVFLNPLPSVFSGTTASETINANNLDNTITGLSGNDSLFGSGGNDTIAGHSGRDTLSGSVGNDVLTGGVGADELLGGDGNDTSLYTDSTIGVQVNLHTGLGAQGTADGDRLVFVENVVGSRYADNLTGDNGFNRLEGWAGNDTLVGMGDNDFLNGGTENDLLNGGAGADSLYGGDGNDLLVGGSGNDLLNGGTGNDRAVFGGTLAITLNLSVAGAQNTGHGQDTLIGIEHVTSGSGNDQLTGNIASNSLAGSAGNDTISGGIGNDSLYGGDGNDQLDSGVGDDFVDGGAGMDRLVFGGLAPIAVDLNVIVSQNTGQGLDIIRNIENVTASSGNDRLIGNGLANVFVGNSGNDQLFGGGGNDTLNAGNGNDAIIGGAGNDLLAGGAGIDSFIFDAVFGTDIVVDFESGPGLGDILNLSAFGILLSDLAITSHASGTGTKITVIATGDSIILSTVAYGTLDAGSDLLL